MRSRDLSTKARSLLSVLCLALVFLSGCAAARPPVTPEHKLMAELLAQPIRFDRPPLEAPVHVNIFMSKVPLKLGWDAWWRIAQDFEDAEDFKKRLTRLFAESLKKSNLFSSVSFGEVPSRAGIIRMDGEITEFWEGYTAATKALFLGLGALTILGAPGLRVVSIKLLPGALNS